ncbi:MAG TPA: HNH endonuclease signature motif containing protein, partial [Polyangiaceae bacterium]|nr:HNH endonuclease signature motif containing protein [Polyangiaceae bacterium]
MSAAVVLEGNDASWRQAHEALVRLATERAGLDFDEGRALLRARRSGAHVRLGFASFLEYTERLFGYGPKLTQDKLRVAEALEELPEIAGQLKTGAINFSVARELTRVAIPATEKEWLEAARGRTVRDVEQLVSGHRPGSLPDDVPDSRLKRHTLRLELSGEVLATFREAMAKIRRDAGEPLDEDAAFLLLCRQALDGNREPGRSSYQIALTVCERCRRATQQGRGELIEVGPEILEMAECDAQHVGHVDDHVGVQHDAGGPAHVHVDDHAGGRAHVDADDHAGGRAHVDAHPRRATQTIAPATRRTVLRRDGGKCRVPGCRHAVFTEPHHLERRCEGGKHLVDNLVTLCGAHHRAA